MIKEDLILRCLKAEVLDSSPSLLPGKVELTLIRKVYLLQLEALN